MSKYDEMPIGDFLREVPRRIDGIATLLVVAVFVLVAVLAPSAGLSVGRLVSWKLSLTILGLVPLTFVYYASLVYFSSSGRASAYINALLVLAVPVLFVYFA